MIGTLTMATFLPPVTPLAGASGASPKELVIQLSKPPRRTKSNKDWYRELARQSLAATDGLRVSQIHIDRLATLLKSSGVYEPTSADYKRNSLHIAYTTTATALIVYLFTELAVFKGYPAPDWLQALAYSGVVLNEYGVYRYLMTQALNRSFLSKPAPTITYTPDDRYEIVKEFDAVHQDDESGWTSDNL